MATHVELHRTGELIGVVERYFVSDPRSGDGIHRGRGVIGQQRDRLVLLQADDELPHSSRGLAGMLGSKESGLARPNATKWWGKGQKSTHAGRPDSTKMSSPAAGFFDPNLSQTWILRTNPCRGQI